MIGEVSTRRRTKPDAGKHVGDDVDSRGQSEAYSVLGMGQNPAHVRLKLDGEPVGAARGMDEVIRPVNNPVFCGSGVELIAICGVSLRQPKRTLARRSLITMDSRLQPPVSPDQGPYPPSRLPGTGPTPPPRSSTRPNS